MKRIVKSLLRLGENVTSFLVLFLKICHQRCQAALMCIIIRKLKFMEEHFLFVQRDLQSLNEKNKTIRFIKLFLRSDISLRCGKRKRMCGWVWERISIEKNVSRNSIKLFHCWNKRRAWSCQKPQISKKLFNKFYEERKASQLHNYELSIWWLFKNEIG